MMSTKTPAINGDNPASVAQAAAKAIVDGFKSLERETNELRLRVLHLEEQVRQLQNKR